MALLCAFSLVTFVFAHLRSENASPRSGIQLPIKEGQSGSYLQGECAENLPDAEDPNYFKRLLELERCACGPVCDTSDMGVPGKYFSYVEKEFDCDALFARSILLGRVSPKMPPKTMPEEMKEFFSMQNHHLPITDGYRDQSAPATTDKPMIWTTSLLNGLINDARRWPGAGERAFKHWRTMHPNEDPYKSAREVMEFMSTHKDEIKKKRCAVIGSEVPWVEAILLAVGAEQVTTVEYAKIVSEDSRVRIMHPDDLAALYKENSTHKPFDCVVSFSSLEHAGLGRYGDIVDPWADLRAMAEYQCLSTPGAAFFIGVETKWKRELKKVRSSAYFYPINKTTGKKRKTGIKKDIWTDSWEKKKMLDEVVWNSNRVYGQLRLPQLFANIWVEDMHMNNMVFGKLHQVKSKNGTAKNQTTHTQKS